MIKTTGSIDCALGQSGPRFFWKINSHDGSASLGMIVKTRNPPELSGSGVDQQGTHTASLNRIAAKLTVLQLF